MQGIYTSCVTGEWEFKKWESFYTSSIYINIIPYIYDDFYIYKEQYWYKEDIIGFSFLLMIMQEILKFKGWDGGQGSAMLFIRHRLK